ncbi:MAG: Antitoxin HigA / UDP-N-acetylglucosamine 1-carboxyvinyltransferase, partial [uncultured Nocardioidaceae bacterium]
DRGLPAPHRSAHPRRPPAPGLDAGAAGGGARHQPERGQPHRARSPEHHPGDGRPHRGGAGLRDHDVRTAAVGPDPPAGDRAHDAERQHRRQVLEERRGRAAVRHPAQPGSHHAAPRRPHRGGQPAPRGAAEPRRADPLAQRRRRPRDRPAGRPRPVGHRRHRRPAYPLGDHVPRPAAAPRGHLRAAVRRRLRPRDPDRRAAHERAAPLRPGGQGHRGQLPRHGRARCRPAAPDRAHRARRHRDRERPHGRGAAGLRDGHPQRQLQLHGAGPLLLPRGARRPGRRCRDDDADRARAARDRRRRRLRAVGGPDRGDVAAGGGDRHRLGDHHPTGTDRVPRDRAGAAGGDGLPLHPQRGVRRGERPHPAGGPHHPRLGAALPHRQDPPDALPGAQHRQPAVLRRHRRRRDRSDAAARLGLREPRDLPHRAQQARRPGAAARPAPGVDRGTDPLVGQGDRLPAGAAPGGRHPAGDARQQGDLGAALGLRDQPGLRGPRRPAQRPRRLDRDVPGQL